MPPRIMLTFVVFMLLCGYGISTAEPIRNKAKGMSLCEEDSVCRERHYPLGYFYRRNAMKSLQECKMIAEQYLNYKSTIDLAKEFGWARETIVAAIKRAGVPLRTLSEANKLVWEQGRHANPRKVSDEELFLSHTKKSNGCWRWTGKIGKKTGYGIHTTCENAHSKCHLAHRFSYELYVGKIPDGLTIDHLCRNRRCVNPKHLEAVTLKENILRGESLPAKNARKTHCHRQHPLSGENLYITPDGRRQCKACGTIRAVKHKEVHHPTNT